VPDSEFPRIWISLSAPQSVPEEGWRDRLVHSALEAGTVIDISKGPALWGGAMRGTDAALMSLGGTDIERAVDAQHAQDLLEAHLIETLSAIGREHLDFYFLQVRHKLSSWQIEGAAKALELAHRDGHVRNVGLCCDGDPLASVAVWNAVEVANALLVPRSHADEAAYNDLKAALSQESKLQTVVTSKALNWGYGMPFVNLPVERSGLDPMRIAQAVVADLAKENTVLVAARTPEEVRAAMEAPNLPQIPEFDTVIESYKEAWEQDEPWEELRRSADPISRKAAERRLSK